MNPPSIVLGGVHGKSCWLIAYKLLLGYSNMVNSCSVYGCKSNYKTTGNGNNVTVFKFPDNTTKQTEWLRKLPK